jgi:hypothetical protein
VYEKEEATLLKGAALEDCTKYGEFTLVEQYGL